MQIGDLVQSKDGLIGVVITVATGKSGGYVEIQSTPDKEGYTRRCYPARHLEVICK